jgi:hypothetical protein
MKKLLLIFVCLSLCFIEFYRIAFTQNIAIFFAYLFDSQLFIQTQSKSYTLFNVIISSIDTVIYSLLHTILSISIIHLYFKNRTYTNYTVIFILFLLFSCVLCFSLYKLTNVYFFYRFTEDLIYTTLSPTPLLILFGFLGLVLPMSNKIKQKRINKY